MNEFELLKRDPQSRRAFIQRMTLAGLGTAALAVLAGCGGGDDSTTIPAGGNVPTPVPTSTVLDPKNFPGIVGRNINEVVLNFALTLEILEADLYRQALNLASGRALTAPLVAGIPASGSTGSYTQKVGNGSISGSLSTAAFLYLVQYAYVEAAHRDFLRVALQSLGAPVAAANAKGYKADLGSSLSSILELLYVVEETGARAYLGAAPFMTFSSPTEKGLVQTAAAIGSTESKHSAAVAYVLGRSAGPVYSIAGVTPGKRVTDGATAPVSSPYSEDTFGYFSDPAVVLNAVKPFIVA